MKKQSLTELGFLNEKIKYEKQKVYSKGLVLLPGITSITCSALANNRFGIAVGSLITVAGLALNSETIFQIQNLKKEQSSKTKKEYVKTNTLIKK